MAFFCFFSPHSTPSELSSAILSGLDWLYYFFFTQWLLSVCSLSPSPDCRAHAGPLRSVAGRFYKPHPSEVQSPSIDFPLGRFRYPIWPYCSGVFSPSVSPADGGRIKRIDPVTAAADEAFRGADLSQHSLCTLRS